MTTLATVIGRGTTAEKADATAVPEGSIYYDTTLSKLQRSNGTCWEDCEPTTGADANAIHDNVSGEIAALNEKTSPASADLLLIEDSADGNAKKKVKIGNLPGGSGGGGAATVRDEAGTVSVANVTTLRVPDGRALSNGAGDVSLLEQWPRLGVGKLYNVKQERLTCNKNATVTLADISGGPGWATEIFIALSSGSEMTRMDSLITITVDGVALPSIRLGAFSCTAATGPENKWQSNRCGKPHHTSAAVTHFHRITIPFNSTLKVEFTNPSGGTNASIYSNVSYYLGARKWDRRARLQANYLLGPSVAPYAAKDLLNVSGRGVLHGLMLLIDSGDENFHPLEGNIQIFVDGEATPSYESSGTEDFFRVGYYGEAGVFFLEDHGMPTRGENYLTTFYRFFDNDPIEFDVSLRIVWHCGELASGQAVTNPAIIDSLVWYYLDSRE